MEVSMLLDKVDRRILDELQANGRQTVRAIAHKLGMSRKTIRYRLNRLTDQGVFAIACVVNADLFGFQFPVVIGINVAPGTSEAVANQLASMPAVRILIMSTGRYAIMAWVLLRDRFALSRFLSRDLAGIADITATEVMHSFQWVKNVWGYQWDPPGVCRQNHPSELDLCVIRMLQKEPRIPITELAKAVGCGRPVARASLQKLLSEGVIRFVNLVDPRAAGYELAVVILIKAKPGEVRAVAEALSAIDQVMIINLVAGQWQILVGAVLEDREKMNYFLLETVPLIPSITEFEVVHLVKIIKYSASFVDLAQAQVGDQ